uniref:Odorant-binding protein 33 n=1 Tax=Encarsia formosa TaxID=32400 RepID=A0A514TTZ5_ENCFO|nr:odorant-binding protein 33 [Encarsia formosa]
MNLHFIIIAGFFVPAVLGMFSTTIVDYLHGLENDCASKSGASKNDVELARKNKFIPDNQKMSEFAKCMLQKFKVMNPDGSVNQNIMEYEVPSDVPNIKEQVSETCKTRVGQNDNESARNIMNCFFERNQLVLAYE